MIEAENSISSLEAIKVSTTRSKEEEIIPTKSRRELKKIRDDRKSYESRRYRIKYSYYDRLDKLEEIGADYRLTQGYPETDVYGNFVIDRIRNRHIAQAADLEIDEENSFVYVIAGIYRTEVPDRELTCYNILPNHGIDIDNGIFTEMEWRALAYVAEECIRQSWHRHYPTFDEELLSLAQNAPNLFIDCEVDSCALIEKVNSLQVTERRILEEAIEQWTVEMTEKPPRPPEGFSDEYLGEESTDIEMGEFDI